MIVEGAIWARDGQIFECIEVLPHVRKDGVPSNLATIGSMCAECGLPYLTKCSVMADEWEDLGITRRCVDHRHPGKRVGPRKQGNRNE